MGNQDKYKYDFKKEDAVRWLTKSVQYNAPVQTVINSEIPLNVDYEKNQAAFGFFCRAYFLVFSEESQELGL